ncbi:MULTISPECIES: peroxiredoxin [Oxalobacteraceae]|uniref:thioredoxin-dependent peroxiredoxin n=2 Tax=Rugamonas TaxID=212744 RepID=A0A843SA86_9BURK|nr:MULTISPECIES: peroxiredoxin [Oxalobacteraceae]ELX10034.1 putative peroxiredoxin [Janthinobacterium sp. HH01]MQA19121.1 redoxin domain-containing protein [Rugamonas rivuli]MQA39678.1 redoxin domain-containing protein [Rugamonas aquatica]OEZ96862.1 putative peroxiredoxin bcp [Duganella sp. HH101]
MADSPSVVPDFSAAMTSGQTFQLSGRPARHTVLFFYPKDNTPGCTTENMAFRDLHEQFQAAGAEVYGISRDSLRSHESFKTKLGLPFELISDPDEAVCLQFGVMKMKQMYGKTVRGIERSTFVIDATGQLVKEWRGVKVAGHVDEVLEFVARQA